MAIGVQRDRNRYRSLVRLRVDQGDAGRRRGSVQYVEGGPVGAGEDTGDRRGDRERSPPARPTIRCRARARRWCHWPSPRPTRPDGDCVTATEFADTGTTWPILPGRQIQELEIRTTHRSGQQPHVAVRLGLGPARQSCRSRKRLGRHDRRQRRGRGWPVIALPAPHAVDDDRYDAQCRVRGAIRPGSRQCWRQRLSRVGGVGVPPPAAAHRPGTAPRPIPLRGGTACRSGPRWRR